MSNQTGLITHILYEFNSYYLFPYISMKYVYFFNVYMVDIIKESDNTLIFII